MRAIQHLSVSLLAALAVTTACLPGPVVPGPTDESTDDNDNDGDNDNDNPFPDNDNEPLPDNDQDDPEPSSDTGAFCDENADCETACLFGFDEDGNQTDFGYCTNPCESFTECPTFWSCEEVGNAAGTFCVQD